MSSDRPRSPRHFATRLNSFQSDDNRATAELLALAASVPGLSAVELNYGQHVLGADEAGTIATARAAGLEVTALNMRFDGPDFALGTFTNPASHVRERAIELCRAAIDVAASNGVPHLIVWPGPDGYDAPFQVDYRAAWDHAIAGFTTVAAHRPDIRVSIEYKPGDPRRMSLIRTMGDALYLVRATGANNLGVTFDLCHGLMTGESPAAAVAMALHAGKLFGVHLNDGFGPADDGLTAGSVHLPQLLELLWYLRTSSSVATLYFDTFPDRVDPVAECAANIDTVTRLFDALKRIDDGELSEAFARHDAVGAQRLWMAALLR